MMFVWSSMKILLSSELLPWLPLAIFFLIDRKRFLICLDLTKNLSAFRHFLFLIWWHFIAAGSDDFLYSTNDVHLPVVLWYKDSSFYLVLVKNMAVISNSCLENYKLAWIQYVHDAVYEISGRLKIKLFYVKFSKFCI